MDPLIQSHLTLTVSLLVHVTQNHMTCRIYSIGHRGVYSFQAASGGKCLLEGGVIHIIINMYTHNYYSLVVHSTVSLCLLRCSQGLLSRQKGHCHPRPL